ncbi:hypothetical protein NJL88_13135 [Streptomyces sp. DK15]|nr:hypothetical protein [Streptomyces sp. DK15]
MTGTLVAITDADLDNMPLPTAKAIETVAFVPADSIDPVRIGASYYLAADGVGAKPYELLRRALQRGSKVAAVRFAMRDREHLGLPHVMDKVIVLHGLRWPDEIRSTDQPPGGGPDAGRGGGAVTTVGAGTLARVAPSVNACGGGIGWVSAATGRLPLLTLRSGSGHGWHGMTKLLP